MTKRKLLREASRVAGAAAVILVGVWGLPADLAAAPVGQPDAIAVPPAALVSPLPPAYTVDEIEGAIVDRPSDFGRVLVDSTPQVAGAETSANVIAWPAGAPLRPDGAVFGVDASPLPVPDGATSVESFVDGASIQTTALAPGRTVTEVVDFYRTAFSSDLSVLERKGRDGSVRLLLMVGEILKGWVVVDGAPGAVAATVVWNL